MPALTTVFTRDEGQTLAEYALILTLIAVVVVTAITLFGGQIGGMWSDISDKFQNLPSP
jgi:Flp pilus assembly pilin Flp